MPIAARVNMKVWAKTSSAIRSHSIVLFWDWFLISPPEGTGCQGGQTYDKLYLPNFIFTICEILFLIKKYVFLFHITKECFCAYTIAYNNFFVINIKSRNNGELLSTFWMFLQLFNRTIFFCHCCHSTSINLTRDGCTISAILAKQVYTRDLTRTQITTCSFNLKRAISRYFLLFCHLFDR